jgi:hypothetical protein
MVLDTTFLAVRAAIRQIVSCFSYYLARCLTLILKRPAKITPRSPASKLVLFFVLAKTATTVSSPSATPLLGGAQLSRLDLNL